MVVLLLVVRRPEEAGLATRPVVVAALAIRLVVVAAIRLVVAAIRLVVVAAIRLVVVAATHRVAAGLAPRPARAVPATHRVAVAIHQATEHLRVPQAMERRAVAIRLVAGCLARPGPRRNRTR